MRHPVPLTTDRPVLVSSVLAWIPTGFPFPLRSLRDSARTWLCPPSSLAVWRPSLGSPLVPQVLHEMVYTRVGITPVDRAIDSAVPLLPGVLEQPAPVGESIDTMNHRLGAVPRPLVQPTIRPFPALHHRLSSAAHRELTNRFSAALWLS